MPIHLPLFISVVATLAVLPGANNAVITRQTLLAGRRAGLLTVAGTSSGIVLWCAFAASGVSAVLVAAPHAMTALRVLGAVLLAALGTQALMATRGSVTTTERADSPRTARAPLIGVASSLSNPKAGVFALALVPQFVSEQGPTAVGIIALGLLWAAISGTWFCLYVMAIDRARTRISSPKGQRWLGRANGVALLGLGAAVIVGL
jgi:threonine/homoserine/homoserine lactone efflux protein